MKRYSRLLAGVILGSIMALLLSSQTGIGQRPKNLVWKAVVPDNESRLLVKRSVAALQEDIAGLAKLNHRRKKDFRQQLAKIRTAAIALAAVIQSTPALIKDRKLATLRDTLLVLSTHARAQNENLIRLFGANLAKIKANPMAQVGPIAMINSLADPEDLMFSLKRRSKGGEGIHPDLQTTARLAGPLNGIEEKIIALSRRRLTEPQMQKEAKQLALMAYQTAAVAQLAEEWSPNVPVGAGQKTRRNWQRWSKDMRDQTTKLAVAATQANPMAVFAAAKRLNGTCNQCHKTFKENN